MSVQVDVLPNEDRLFWLSYIETSLGLVLPPLQQRRFETRIAERIKAHQLTSDGYFKKLTQDESEWQALIDELTIPETSFFRHPPSFDLVAKHLADIKGAAHLWSVGCSTGEEAWSLAIIGDEHGGSYRVMATDVSQSAINTAQAGFYPDRKVLGAVSRERLERHFGPVELANRGAGYQVQAHLRQHVSFYQHNLVAETRLPFREIDVIFCQNVLIYFRNFVQRDILNHLVKSLSLGGLLILAPAEARGWQHPAMAREEFTGTLAFRKVSA